MPQVQQHKRRSVELLLAENVPSLGKQGEIVQVRAGYARNYLLPQGLATVATEHNKRMVEKHKQNLAELEKKRLAELKKIADAISKYSVTIEAHANEEGHLYGSIGANDISKSLRSASFDVAPDCVKLEGPLKELAMYTVKIQLHAEVATEVKVWVVPAAAK
jgi:large subunit ribosomal protein L9